MKTYLHAPMSISKNITKKHAANNRFTKIATKRRKFVKRNVMCYHTTGHFCKSDDSAVRK